MGDAPNTFVQVMSDLIPRDTFERIQNLHQCDNEQLDEQLFKQGEQIHRTNLWFFISKFMAVENNKQHAHLNGIQNLGPCRGIWL